VIVAANSLTSYISRIRRRESRTHRLKGSVSENIRADQPPLAFKQSLPAPADRLPNPQQPPGVNPIAQAMHALTKPRFDIRKLHSDGDPTGKDLI